MVAVRRFKEEELELKNVPDDLDKAAFQNKSSPERKEKGSFNRLSNDQRFCQERGSKK